MTRAVPHIKADCSWKEGSFASEEPVGSMSLEMVPYQGPSPSIRCSVCNQQAFGMNYGVVSCNACKMFFRRVVMVNPGYHCRENNICYQGIESSQKRPRCRSCRFARCLKVGMRYSQQEDEVPRVPTARFDKLTMCAIVSQLLHLDSARIMNIGMMRTDEDPTIDDLINQTRNFSLEEPRTTSYPPTPQILSELSFLGIWTSVEFHNRLDFMAYLDPADKKILIKNFAIKSYLLSSAFRCFNQKSEKLVNPDGSELFPPCVQEIPQFSKDVERIQRLLVTKLAELDISPEEYILATVILFCNSALTGLSPYAQQLVSDKARFYCKALHDYAMINWDNQGPARFQSILFLGDTINKCFGDVQNLVNMLLIFHPNSYSYKRLFIESIGKPDNE